MKGKCVFCGQPGSDNATLIDGTGVIVCDACVERMPLGPGSYSLVLHAIGAAELARRVAKLEALTKAVDWNEMPFRRAQARADGWDGKSVVSVDGFPTRPVPARVPGESGYSVRLESYNYLAEKYNELRVESAKLTAKLMDWRNAQRMTVSAIGHEHDGVWAKVPEGER